MEQGELITSGSAWLQDEAGLRGCTCLGVAEEVGILALWEFSLWRWESLLCGSFLYGAAFYISAHSDHELQWTSSVA